MTPAARIGCFALIVASAGFSVITAASEAADAPLVEPAGLDQASPADAAHDVQGDNLPPLMAEGANSCEIVSCGMGIKDTCKITCPSDKTPKCSCDCAKSFGPMCTEYKANCRCE
jgi:hypothetical protein